MSDETRHADDYNGSGDSDASYGREFTTMEREHLFPDGWPYTDLPLRLRNCPWCGFEMVCIAAEPIHPMALCHNAECSVLTWDPTRTARDTVASLDDQEREDGGR